MGPQPLLPLLSVALSVASAFFLALSPVIRTLFAHPILLAAPLLLLLSKVRWSERPISECAHERE